jgi:hypothetical protein
MKIPEWLKKRSLLHEIPDEISLFAENNKINLFEELSVEILNSYHQSNQGKSFFRLIRLLGFYGVIFYRKLAHYSGPIVDNPKLLSVNNNYWNEKIVFSSLSTETISRLYSFGIITFNYLHGVPFESYAKLISKHHGEEIVKSDINPFQVVLSTELSNREDKKAISIKDLKLSIRTLNCLKGAEISSINDLILYTDKELLNIRNFGKTCLSEIKSKLSELNLELRTEAVNKSSVVPLPPLDLRDDNLLYNLSTSINDIPMSKRLMRCLDNKNIEYVYQLVQLNVSDLLKIRNFGKKSLTEMENILSNMSLSWSIKLTNDDIKIIKAYEKKIDERYIKLWLEKTIPIFHKCNLNFLTKIEKSIALNRIFELNVFKATLETLANSHKLTRERIRQLEKKAKEKIRRELNPELREVTAFIESKVSRAGNLAQINNIGIGIENLKYKDQEIVSQLIYLESDEIFIDWRYKLISGKGQNYLDKLCKDIKREIGLRHKDNIFDDHEFDNIVNRVSLSYNLFDHEIFKNLKRKFINLYKVTKDRKFYNIGKFPKIEKIALYYKELFPNGLEIYINEVDLLEKMKQKDPEEFRDATTRSIIGHLINHQSVLLWGRGFYIHEQNISYNKDELKNVIKWILDHFDSGNSRFLINLPFNYFKKTLMSSGIPNEYALYTLLRKEGIERIGLRKFPSLIDLESEVSLSEGVTDEVENYFNNVEKELNQSDIINEFVKRRGWKEYRVQNIIANSDKIIPWRNGTYIHINYLTINHTKLNELVEKLRKKIELIKTPISLKGAKKENELIWEQACPSGTTRTISKLIRILDISDLIIENNFIRLDITPTETVSVSAALEDYFLKKNNVINLFDIKAEFNNNRGWSANQLYNARRNTRVFQYGNDSFVHPKTISWNDKLSQEVSEVLSGYLRNRITDRQPHVQISHLIYEYALPDLPNEIEWTRQLILSVGKEFDEFVFFDDAYILSNNEQNIEDLDDMIGFLIAREFRLGIVKCSKIEKLLWREGILLSGRKIAKNQFFEGSSICYLENNQEICLSDIGKSRYGKR